MGDAESGFTADAAAWTEARASDRRAASTLNVVSALGRDRVVCVQPDRSGTERNCALRSLLTLASLRDECIVHRNVIHVPRPNQQRIRRVRCALITMPATFDDETQTVVASKVYCGSDVVRISRRHRVNARLRGPCIRPTQSLRQPGLIADVVGVI